MRAFTLIELSIVLIIIGLLVGGVLAGRDLIRQAELGSANREYQAYNTAVYTFYSKYDALPGDMDSAESYWGASTTDNGDDDGQIANAERHLFWQHLGLAGLADGSYTGVAGGGGAGHSIIGENCPASKLQSGGWGVMYVDNSGAGTASIFALNLTNTFILGADNAPYMPGGALLSPQEAYQLDTKYDDGIPSSGRWSGTVACTDADDNEDLVATYSVNDTSVQCAFRITAPALNQ